MIEVHVHFAPHCRTWANWIDGPSVRTQPFIRHTHFGLWSNCLFGRICSGQAFYMPVLPMMSILLNAIDVVTHHNLIFKWNVIRTSGAPRIQLNGSVWSRTNNIVNFIWIFVSIFLQDFRIDRDKTEKWNIREHINLYSCFTPERACLRLMMWARDERLL